MNNFDVYQAKTAQKPDAKEYGIEDQLTFDDLLEELEDRNTF